MKTMKSDTAIDNIDWDNDLQKWTLRGEPEDIPTVDAVEVVHGRWLFITKGQQASAYACSECNRVVTLVCDEDKVEEQLAKKYPYCHCGAKMDGDGNGTA